MIEKFEHRLLKGKLKVACKYDDGSIRYWQTEKETVVKQIKQIVDSYQAQDYTLTLRQLHYQFVSRNWIVNHETAYKKLGKILDDCRYAGVIDWDAIEDRGRKPYLPYSANTAVKAVQDLAGYYRVNRQLDQTNHVEVWTEKDALSGIMARSTSKYHIRLVVNKGYTSSSAIYDAYHRFVPILANGNKVTILYFGDHDPSGLDMIRDINERLWLMIENGHYKTNLLGCDFEVIPIGLTMKQIKKYKCPPNPAKMTDTRAEKYIAKFGKSSWEVDALNPETLTEIVETNIKNQIDMSQFETMLIKEGSELKKLKNFIKKTK
jgi:hypothetical protein